MIATIILLIIAAAKSSPSYLWGLIGTVVIDAVLISQAYKKKK